MLLTHYTRANPDVHTILLDPHRFGQNKQTASDKRNYSRPRVYFYAGQHEPESWLGKDKYETHVPDEDVYDIEKDPGNIKDERDPEDPRRLVHYTTGAVINEVLKRGFKGVKYGSSWGDVVALFHPTEVHRAKSS